MRPLKEVLESLNRELEDAVPSTWARATVRLEILLRDSDAGVPSWWVRSESDPAPSPGTPATVLELELHPVARPISAPVSSPGSGHPSDPKTVAASEAPPGVGADTVAILAEVLGAPGGFAAYCRADTLATALESLRDEDWAVFVRALDDARPKELDPVVQAAWGTFRNALRSGPAGSVEAGLAKVRETLRSRDRGEWIRLLRTHWRNEPAPIPDPPGIRVDSPSSRN